MKKCLFISVIILLFGCNRADNQLFQNVENKIIFDYRNSINKFDIGMLTDSIAQIIPLETTDSSLIANIDKIEIKNNTIFIKDDLSKSVLMFSKDGKFINKIQAIGQGPGEYVSLSNMTVTDSTLILIDHLVGKQIDYRLSDLRFLKEERIFEKIWAMEIFTLNNSVFYYNGWSNSKLGKFRLFSRKLNEMNFEKHLPFRNEPFSLDISGSKYAVNGSEAAIIFSGDNVIYRINSHGDVFPGYEIIFKNNSVVYSSGKIENVFRDNPPGRILNINSINESEKFLFIDISVTIDNEKPIQPGNYDKYTCIYDKLSHETIIYPHFAYNSKFDNQSIVIRKIIDNKLITWMDAHILKVLNDESYSPKRTFTNKLFKKQLQEVLTHLKEDDNPILFIYNLK